MSNIGPYLTLKCQSLQCKMLHYDKMALLTDEYTCSISLDIINNKQAMFPGRQFWKQQKAKD